MFYASGGISISARMGDFVFNGINQDFRHNGLQPSDDGFPRTASVEVSEELTANWIAHILEDEGLTGIMGSL